MHAAKAVGRNKHHVFTDELHNTNRTRLIIYPEDQRKKSDEDAKSKEPSP